MTIQMKAIEKYFHVVLFVGIVVVVVVVVAQGVPRARSSLATQA